MPERLVRGKAANKVVLVSMQGHFSNESWPGAEQRAEAELGALGFQVVRVEARTSQLSARMAELGAHAAGERALASVSIVRQGGTQVAQIWLHDALTGKMLLRSLDIGESTSGDAGMRVVELLHASLLETQMRDPRQTPNAIHRLVKRRLAQLKKKPAQRQPGALWGLAVAPMLQLSPGEGSLAAGVAIALQRWLWPELAIGLSLATPIFPAVVRSTDGEADLQLISSRVEAAYGPWPRAALSPALFVGFGVLVLRSSGRAEPPHAAAVDWAAAAAATLGARVDVRLTARLSLYVGAEATLALPPLGVRLVEQRIAVLGRPLLQLSLGLQWLSRGR